MIRVYKSVDDIIIEREGSYALITGRDWDDFINDDNLFVKASNVHSHGKVIGPVDFTPEAPMHSQELWASGVTYYRSMQGRQEESKEQGGGQFYAHVYDAPRPELFFKATRHRVVGHNGLVRIRKDSSWDVPEPELTLFVTSSGKIVGYTIGNDMSSRSIEGENPLYLPQAKTYDGCAALGPCILLTESALGPETRIRLKIERSGQEVFSESIAISRMKRTPDELVEYLYRENTFPKGCFLMTGTGIVPEAGFTLRSGDQIEITIDHIGTLQNVVS